MPRPNYTAIQALEHDLLGIQPSAGSFSAASLGFRMAGMCATHQPVADVGRIPVSSGRCAGCGRGMTLGASGEWELLKPMPALPPQPVLLEAGERVVRPAG